MRKYLFTILTLICCHAFGQNPVFYKTTKKHNLYLIEMSGEIEKIYKELKVDSAKPNPWEV